MSLRASTKALALFTVMSGLLVLTLGSAQAQGFSASGVLLQPEGKILAAGWGSYSSIVQSRFALARYEPNGSLDSGFGTRGRVLTRIPASSGIVDAGALQPDGKIVTAGSSSAGGIDKFTLARYNPDGSLDPGFGTGGIVTTAIGPSTDFAYAVALQPDGKIVAAGASRINPRPSPSNYEVALVRYNADGSLDPSFGTGGKVLTQIQDASRALAVALQPDGKIVVSGVSVTQGGTPLFALARYLPDGSLDSSFGTGGTVTTALGGPSAFGNSLALQPDGKIVVGGVTQTAGALQDRFALVRYNPDGSLDPTFGDGGIVATAVSEHAFVYALALQPDGKIVAAGAECDASCGQLDFALARYDSDGSLDTSFGTAGIVTTAFAASSGASAIALQPDSKIVVAGFSGLEKSCACGSIFALARYMTNGSLDSSFGTGGKVTTSFTCVVPKVKGRLLATAKRKIVRARCSVGTVKRRFSREVRKGRIISQRPTSASRRFAGAKVSVVVSRGQRRHP
jgi:uncharacterized delta-60 repeat protein